MPAKNDIPKKAIVIDSCDMCPFHGKCKAWTRLNRQQRIQLTIGNQTPQKFILAKCPLIDIDSSVETFEGV